MGTSADAIFELFKDIPGAYPDFVRFTPSVAEPEGLADDLLDYMQKNRIESPSDVLEWISDKAGWEYK